MKRLHGTAYPFVVENDKCMEEIIQTNVRCGTSSTHVCKGYMKYMLNRKYDIYFLNDRKKR